MTNLSLKLIGYTIFFNFESYTINYFHDIISYNIPSDNKKFYLYIQAVDYNGIYSGEWIAFDLTRTDFFTAIEDLHIHLINSINRCSKFNNDLASTIIFEDDKDRIVDYTIKHISITFYEQL